MPDMLGKLYNLEHNWSFIQEQENLGLTIRKPIGPEKHSEMDWGKETLFCSQHMEVYAALRRLLALNLPFNPQ